MKPDKFWITLLIVFGAAQAILSAMLVDKVRDLERRLNHQEALMVESIESHQITSEILKETLRQ